MNWSGISVTNTVVLGLHSTHSQQAVTTVLRVIWLPLDKWSPGLENINLELSGGGVEMTDNQTGSQEAPIFDMVEDLQGHGMTRKSVGIRVSTVDPFPFFFE